MEDSRWVLFDSWIVERSSVAAAVADVSGEFEVAMVVVAVASGMHSSTDVIEWPIWAVDEAAEREQAACSMSNHWVLHIFLFLPPDCLVSTWSHVCFCATEPLPATISASCAGSCVVSVK